MKNKLILTLLPLFAISFLCQCKKDKAVNESTSTKAKAEFAVRYLESEQQLRGQVALFTNDSTENESALEVNGGVAFMSSGTKKRSLPNGTIRYENTINNSLIQPMQFRFSLEGDSSPREINFNMTPIDDFSMESASLADGLRLQLSSSLLDDESFLLFFTNPDGEARTIIRPGPLKDLKLFVPSDALLHFTTGSYQLYLVKSKKITTSENGLDYKATIEYYSKEIEFALKE